MQTIQKHKEVLSHLSSQLNDFTPKPHQKPSSFSFFSKLKSGSSRNVLLYSVLPVVIFLLFLILSPSFVKVEREDEKGNKIHELSLTRVLVIDLILTGIVYFILFKFKNK